MKRILLASALGAAISLPLPANAVNANPGNLPRDNGSRGDRSRDDQYHDRDNKPDKRDDQPRDRDNKPDKRDDKPVVVKVDQPPRRDGGRDNDRGGGRDNNPFGGRPTGSGIPGINRGGDNRGGGNRIGDNRGGDNRGNPNNGGPFGNPNNGGPFGNRPPRPGNGGGPVYPPGIPSPGHDGYKGNSYPNNRDRNVGHYDWDHHDNNDHHLRDRDWGHRDNRWDYSSTRTVIINRDIYVPTYSYDPYPVYIEPRDPYLDDLEVEARQIKTALRNDRDLQYCDLDTDTVGYSIEVEGYVDNEDQLQRILDVSRDIDKDVRIVISRVRIR